MATSPLRSHVFRLLPHQDLKKGILEFAAKNRIQAGCIVTCVGSLEQYHLRFANRKKGTRKKGHFEITSLTGTFSDSLAHLHLSVSDKKGKATGGHLLEGNLIFTTAEIVVGELSGLTFAREKDDVSGYLELAITKKKKQAR
jgi:predicted DNA-binding protein with PD1-like motif